MNNLFLFLVLVSIVGFVVGLIKPSIFKMESRKKVSYIFGGSLILFFILFGITSPKSQNTNIPEKKDVSEIPQKVTSIFDVPSLIGKDINGVMNILGTPNKDNGEPTSLQIEMGINEWSKSYEKDGRELLITYNYKTKEIIDFFIPSTDSEYQNKDKEHMLLVGGLEDNNRNYSVEFVKSVKDNTRFTGIKITPNK